MGMKREGGRQTADLEKVPQLILNYTTGSADGISIAFLTVWLIGDITNLAGAFIFPPPSPLLPFQLGIPTPGSCYNSGRSYHLIRTLSQFAGLWLTQT